MTNLKELKRYAYTVTYIRKILRIMRVGIKSLLSYILNNYFWRSLCQENAIYCYGVTGGVGTARGAQGAPDLTVVSGAGPYNFSELRRTSLC